MYKIHHSRGKSDTNFYQEQTILNGAYSSLKVLRVTLVNDLAQSTLSQKKKSQIVEKRNSHSKGKSKEKKNIEEKKLLNKNNSSEDESNEDDSVGKRILILVERVLLFKQELDDYFFENKIHLLKFHLNNMSEIIIKSISDLQNELITECPILKNSHIVRIFGNFSDIISTFIETKPQDFYREIKDAILNQWEKNRIKIKQLFEKIEKNCNIKAEKENEEINFSIYQFELYQGSSDSIKKIADENTSFFLTQSTKKIIEDEEENIKRLKKIDPNTLYYLIKKKKEIMSFVTSVTQYILFSISRLYYDMDYYSIIISSLQFKIFYAIMYYIDSYKDKKDYLTDSEKGQQKKVFHIINHFIHLALSFNKNIKTGKISLDNGGLNSLSKYILNNFIEIVSKCQGLKMPTKIQNFKNPTLYQIYHKTKFYKCYLQRYKKYKDNSLLRIFMLYYNSKMIFWKSILIIAKPKDDKKNFICRTCEKEIPLEDLFLHLGCCKEQQSFYDKMKGIKIAIQNYITQLDIYIAKNNLNITPVNKKLFGKGGNIYKILRNISGCDNDENGINFIKKLKELFIFEKKKPDDFYEKKPEEISFIVSMSYFILIIFLLNKISSETDQDLSEILGGAFCKLLQIFMNVQFLLYINKSQTKNTIIKNRKKRLITDSFQKENVIKNNKNDEIIQKNNISEKRNEDKSSSDDENFFNPELNFKSVIQKYKTKLSLNHMIFSNNSFNSTKTKTNDRTRFNSPNTISKAFSCNAFQSDKNIDFFSKKSGSININKKKRYFRFHNASSTKVTDSLSNINPFNSLNSKICKNKIKKRSHSNKSMQNAKLNLNSKQFLKLNTFNYRPAAIRSLKMTKNNSSENIFLNKKKGKMNTSNKDNRSIDSSSYNSGSGMIPMLSETESSGEFEQNSNKLNIFKDVSNLSRADSYLSRIDSNIHRLDSNISRGDSIENNLNKFEDENSNSNDKNKNNFILNNNQNFQLGYRGDQSKKNFNRLSLFGSKTTNKKSPTKKPKTIGKKRTLFKNDAKEKKKNKNNNDSMNQSSELDDSNSSHGQNILVHEEEEEVNDNKNENKNKSGKNIDIHLKEEEEDINDFFAKKGKTNEISNNNINKEFENNIIYQSSSYDSSESNNIEFAEPHRITTKEFEDILPNMLYIKPGNQNNMNFEHIADLFNELMEEAEGKNNTSIEQSMKKNSIISKDKDLDTKKQFDINSFTNTDLVNISSIKSKDADDNNNSDINSIKDLNLSKINLEENKKENENKICKFKLILPIAKGGYGSVGLYKNVLTSDTYAIKTVDINSMKEKKLSNSLKNEQNILKEINNDYVVNSYYIFQDKKNYYFVMEYLPGGDVYTLLSKNNLPKKTIQLIVAETILAVNYLHSIFIIHHDIKPENILISLKGHFKLSDFGLSKTLQEYNEFDVVKNIKKFVEFNKFPINLGDDEDENKDAVGTLNYMAPELFTDKYPHGGGIDYWAIGVLIFDLYSYSLPFEAKTQEEMRKNIIEIKIDWSKLINDEVKKIYGNIDPAVDLIKKFLKENPAERWGDKNLDEIKKHKFFEGFNWDDIKNIKNDTIKEYVKQRVKENNNKIKQLNLKNKAKKEKGENNEKENKTEDGYPSVIEINMTENEEKYFFTERYDNLNKKNNELIKKKIEKEAASFKENISDLMLIDLE